MIGRTNAVQENSISATIEVSAPTGSTVSCDGIVGTEQSGLWTFAITSYGLHTISATYNGTTKTETVQVNAERTYEVTITFLPYALLTGIQSTGTQSINTDLTPTIDTKITIDCKQTSLDSNYRGVIGARGTSNPVYYLMVGTNSTEGIYAYDGRIVISSSYDTSRHLYIVTTTQNNISVSTDGNVVTSSGGSYVSTTGKITVFSINNWYANSIVYDTCKIEQGGQLLRDLKPCILLESVTDYWGNTQPIDEIGMWDLVSNKFFPNNGTGEFIAIE